MCHITLPQHTQTQVNLDFNDDDENRVLLLVHDTKPPFLDGRFLFTKQKGGGQGDGGGVGRKLRVRALAPCLQILCPKWLLDRPGLRLLTTAGLPLASPCPRPAGPVLPLKDSTSDMAVIARQGSKLVKEVREKKESTKSRQRFWEVAGSKMGKITGAPAQGQAGAGSQRRGGRRWRGASTWAASPGGKVERCWRGATILPSKPAPCSIPPGPLAWPRSSMRRRNLSCVHMTAPHTCCKQHPPTHPTPAPPQA